MIKKGYLFLIAAAFFVLSGCNEEEQSGVEIVDELTPIDVELNVPSTAGIGESVLFSSVVTQGEDVVDDANEVVFEIWLDSQREQSELVEADQQDGHIYQHEYTFTKAGVYHVQTHVTARGLHRMPTSQIQVGDTVENVHSNEDEHDNVHEHQHQHSHVTIDQIVKEDRLVLLIELEGTPFNGGRVTIEMSAIDEEQVHWVDLMEQADGEYVLLDVDDYSGTYKAIVHIEDDHIHEHFDIELHF